jgi:hypothetical protein
MRSFLIIDYVRLYPKFTFFAEQVHYIDPVSESNKMNKNFLALLSLVVLVFPGCSKYGYVNLDFPLDPQVILPAEIKTIAVVNRSLTKESDKTNNILESIATGEIAGSDRLASDECLKSVFDKLNGNGGFTIVIPQKTRLYGTGTNQTPELLNWKLVKSICDDNHADALLVLETFDSNSDLLASAVTQQVGEILQGNGPKPVVPREVRITVHAFWRLYDPSTKKIIDQYKSTGLMTFNACGNTIAVPPPEALPNTAYAAGQEYSSRLLPGFYTVKRDMFKKGKGKAKEQFRAAFRRAETANWEGAINGFKAIEKSGGINAGRAALNIAVSYEVLGKTDQALEWAKKSYEDYGNSLGRDYTKILLRRQDVEIR